MSKVNMEPKTIEEFRDLTKVLKLKVMKQAQTIQSLQAKCKKYEDDLGSSNVRMNQRNEIDLGMTKNPGEEINQDELNSLKGKSQVMRKFLKSANMFGITPQAIYRIADIHYTNSIESDYFRTILSKMVLHLTPKQISCIIFIFDEHCLGYISKEDYDNSLHAYEIAIQQKSLPYTQECLLRFCGLLYSERIDLNKFYDEMKEMAKAKNSRGDVDLVVFEEQAKRYFTGKLQERQIVGAFNQINLEKQRSIEKKNFLYGVNSFTNRLLNEDRLQNNVISASQIQTSSQANQTSHLNLKNSRSQLRIPGSNQQSSILINQRGQRHEQHEQDPLDRVLKEKNIQFQDIALQMVQIPMRSRLTIHQFRKCFTKMLIEFTTEDIAIIFRAIDVRQEGSIDVFDAINFCLTRFKDVHLVLIFIGKSLQCTSTSPEEFWNSQQFEDFSRAISKSRFLEIMAKNCNTPNPQSWDVVWNFFDKGKGTISVQSIIDVWKKYHLE